MDYKQIIEEHYAVKVNNINLLESHFGTDIYCLMTDNCKYILKSFPLYMESAKNEGSVAAFLLSKGLKVARFLKTYNGDYYVATDQCIMTLQEYIKGTTLQVNSAPDWFIEESARLLGRINVFLSNYGKLPLRFDGSFFSKDAAIQKKIQYENELLIAREKGDTGIVLLFEEQIKHLSRISGFCIDTNALSYVNSHGDYHIGQAIIDGKDITIIDWASACKLPICLEVITSFVFASPKCKDGSVDVSGLKNYIKQYCKYFPLSEYDIKAMPYVLYFWHCMCNYSPQEDIPNSYRPISDLIQKLLNWLFDNVETLSEALCRL